MTCRHVPSRLENRSVETLGLPSRASFRPALVAVHTVCLGWVVSKGHDGMQGKRSMNGGPTNRYSKAAVEAGAEKGAGVNGKPWRRRRGTIGRGGLGGKWWEHLNYIDAVRDKQMVCKSRQGRAIHHQATVQSLKVGYCTNHLRRLQR